MRGTRLLAVSKRILRQFARDRRTLALIIVAPVAVLWLVKLLLTTEDYQPRIAVLDDVPAPLYNRLAQGSARLSRSSAADAETALARNEIDAIIAYVRTVPTPAPAAR